jgi:hypothetical protein
LIKEKYLQLDYIAMVIEWDYLIVEMVLLAGILWFTVYIEHWAYRWSQVKEDKKDYKKHNQVYQG